MIRVHAAGRTDVGQVRDSNEDALHVGDSVFAVADGMGGHAAGEVASSTALEPVHRLDGRVYAEAADARNALRDAVVKANHAVVEKASREPSFHGMGTTLTAVMVEGRRAHVAHVGDSRAYLFRDDTFMQLTTDHTVVQRMIDEGRITPAEAATHPQRSMVTRAIGVESEVDVDALTLDLMPGDLLVLCSDGLTGPVVDDEIIATIEGHLDEQDLDARPEQIANHLVEAANDAGGPDNITVVVIEFEDLPNAPEHRREEAEPVLVSTAPDSRDDGDWASRLGSLGNLNDTRAVASGVEAGEATGASTGRGRRIAFRVIVIGLLIGALVAGGRWVLARSWYVGLDDQQLVIYQGVPAEVGPLNLYWEHDPTDVTTEGLPDRIVNNLEEGEVATSQEDAERLVDHYRTLGGQGDEDEEEPSG